MTTAPPAYRLNDGSSLPAIGFGTWPLRGEEGIAALVSALELGYRLIDSAVNYGNEREAGEAVRRCGIPREQILITTKIPGRHHAYDLARQSMRDSCERLGVEYVDLALIHWPNPRHGLYGQAWKALVDAREAGQVRTIGVSNFTASHLRRIVDDTGVVPALNQIELHPYYPQAQMRAVHAELGIRTEAWSPLGKRSAPYREAPVVAAAAAHGVTPAQAILRWHVELGCVPLPKSATPSRQRENLDVFGFQLTEQQVAGISGLARPDGRLFGGDPDTHEEM